jgi:hypothetical protein
VRKERTRKKERKKEGRKMVAGFGREGGRILE